MPRADDSAEVLVCQVAGCGGEAGGGHFYAYTDEEGRLLDAVNLCSRHYRMILGDVFDREKMELQEPVILRRREDGHIVVGLWSGKVLQ